MAIKGVSCVRGKVATDDCVRCSLNPLHPCSYPTDFIQIARRGSDIGREGIVFSPSTLLDCDRRTVLTTGLDYYVDVDAAWNLQRGGIVHELVEHNGEYPEGSVYQVIRERRLEAEVDTKYGPMKFSGKPDLVVIKNIDEDGTAWAKIVDYKTTTITHELTEARRTNQTQLNCYAWLVERCLKNWYEVDRVVVDELEIVYTDLKRVRRFTSAGWLSDRGKSLRSMRVSRLNDDGDWFEVHGRTGNVEVMQVMFDENGEASHEKLDLAPIDLLPMEDIEAWIIKRMEEKIEAKEKLPDPLEPPNDWVCSYCPVRSQCFKLAGKEI